MRLNLFAPMNSLGMGVHAYNLARAFEGLSHQISLIPPFGKVRIHDHYIDGWLANAESFDAKAPSLMIFDLEYMSQFSGEPRIGMAVFETEKFTRKQAAMVRSCDYLFTPSGWGKSVLESVGIPAARIRVVNEGYDPAIYRFGLESGSEKDGGPFTFATVGKFEGRKGTTQIIRCFSREFRGAGGAARLLLHVENPFDRAWKEKAANLIKAEGFSSGNGRDFYAGACSMTVSESLPCSPAWLYGQADCAVFPARAEGWNLPLMEALATGVPAIAGNWTGHTEYLTDEQFLVVPESQAMKVPARDDAWFADGDRGEWFEMTDARLQAGMRDAFSRARAVRKTMNWRAECERIREFTWARAAGQLERVVSEVCGW